jgi:hypothetical protein
MIDTMPKKRQGPSFFSIGRFCPTTFLGRASSNSILTPGPRESMGRIMNGNGVPQYRDQARLRGGLEPNPPEPCKGAGRLELNAEGTGPATHASTLVCVDDGRPRLAVQGTGFGAACGLSASDHEAEIRAGWWPESEGV